MTEAANKPMRKHALVLILAALLAIISFSPWVDDLAAEEYEENFDRALIVFGLARGLNAVISVVQGTELSVQPAGVGLNFAPGQIVDPVNDLIERFSWVMLASATSLGVQQIMLDVSRWWGISLIVLLALGWCLWAYLKSPQTDFWRRFGLRFLYLSLLLRFAIPLMVLAEQAVFKVFVEDQYQQSTQQITQTQQELETMTEESADQEHDQQGFFSSVRRWLDQTADKVDVRKQLAEFQEKLAEVTEDLLRLTAIFILKTIIFPIGFLWVFVKALAAVTRLGQIPQGSKV